MQDWGMDVRIDAGERKASRCWGSRSRNGVDGKRVMDGGSGVCRAILLLRVHPCLLLLVLFSFNAELRACEASIESLRPLCTSVLACELSHSGQDQDQPPTPVGARSRDASRLRDGREQRQACALAKSCYQATESLCRREPDCADRKSRPARCEVLITTDWERRERLHTLGKCLLDEHSEKCSKPSADAHGNRFASELPTRIATATELTRHVYGARCDSPWACMRWVADRSNRWQSELALQRELLDVQQDGNRRAAEHTVAVEESTLSAAATIDSGLRDIANAQLEGSLLLSGTLLETLRSENSTNWGDKNRVKAEAPGALQKCVDTAERCDALAENAQGQGASSIGNGSASPQTAPNDQSVPSPSSPSTSVVNITEAMMQLGAATRELGVATDRISEATLEGLEKIAEAALLGNAAKTVDPDAVRRQIDPYDDLERWYPHASRFEYGILLVPDPRIPRHRRGYDLSLTGISSGMLEAGYVLDRYSVPWQAYLDDAEQGTRPSNEQAKADDGHFGILVFRKDGWRHGAQGTQLRILYLVAESGTYGVQQQAMVNALLQLHAVTAAPRTKAEPEPADIQESTSSLCPKPKPTPAARKDNRKHTALMIAAAGSSPALLVIGPRFSGSVDSLQAARSKAEKALGPEGAATRKQLQAIHSASGDLRLHLAANGNLAPEIQRQLRSLLVGTTLALSDGALSDPKHPVAGMLQRLAKRTSSQLCDTTQATPMDGLLVEPNELQDSIARLAQALGGLKREGWEDVSLDVDLISPSATNSSNVCITEEDCRLRWRSLATDDRIKLDALHKHWISSCWTQADKTKCPRPNQPRVALLTENSVFGSGLCPSKPSTGSPPQSSELCDSAFRISFPANIADIRYGARLRSQRLRDDALGGLGLSAEPSSLQLADGAENGSEFPDSQRSPLTTTSATEQLSALLKEINRLQPEMIIVAATDVRDRLFLFSRLRSTSPKSLLVDLEADRLLAHRDYLHATRGILALSSTGLGEAPILDQKNRSACNWSPGVKHRVSRFSTDAEANLHKIAAGFFGQQHGRPGSVDTRCQDRSDTTTSTEIHFLTPTRQGLQRLSYIAHPDKPSHAAVSVSRFLGSLLGAVMVGAFLLGFLVLLQAERAYQFLRRPTGLLVLALIVFLALVLLSGGGRSAAQGLLLSFDSGLAPGSAFWLCAMTILAGGELLRRTVSDATVLGQLIDANPRQLLVAKLDLLVPPVLWITCTALLAWALALTSQGWPSGFRGPFDGQLPVDQVLLWCIAGLSLGAILCLAVAGSQLWRLRRFEERLAHFAYRHTKRLGLRNWNRLAAVVPARSGESPRHLHPEFALTPMAARQRDFAWPISKLHPSASNADADAGAVVVTQLQEMNLGFQDEIWGRLALAYVAATLCEAMRRMLMLGFGLCVSVVLIAVAYPVPLRDGFLLLVLALMVLGTLLSFYAVLATESWPMLSRLLCNSEPKLRFSWQVLVGLLAPVLLLIAVVLALEVPGVLEWGGGLFGPFLSWMRS